MKSFCYVILPLDTDVSNLGEVVRKQIYDYYSEKEVPPYKEYFRREYTYIEAQRLGFGTDLEAFGKYLNEQYGEDVGIENELYYFMSTGNPDDRWDYFIVEECKKGLEFSNDTEFPYSIVTPDGKWYSQKDLGYIPRLDFQNNVKVHPDNEEAYVKWNQQAKGIVSEYPDNTFVIIMVHS